MNWNVLLSLATPNADKNRSADGDPEKNLAKARKMLAMLGDPRVRVSVPPDETASAKRSEEQVSKLPMTRRYQLD